MNDRPEPNQDQANRLLALLSPAQRDTVESRRRCCAPCGQNQKLGVVSVKCQACGCAGVSLIHGRCKLRKWPLAGEDEQGNAVRMPDPPPPKPDPPAWESRPAIPHASYRNAKNTRRDGAGSNDVFVYGFPGLYAGANTELHHQVVLWRSMGLSVHLIPGGPSHNEPLYPEMLDRGVIVHEPNDFAAILPGAPVLGFCNDRFLARIDEILRYSHNTVFVNCMTWLFEQEKLRQREGKIAAFLYQNEAVRRKNQAILQAINPDPTVRYLDFKPYFDAEAFPFNKADPSEQEPAKPFTIGRISRQDADKYSADTLSIWDAIASPDPKRGLMLGFGDKSEEKIGRPPDWVQTFENQKELTQQDFYRGVDALVQPMDTTENWPRVGLEAMASGCVLIVDNRGGWQQMIEHGVTGWLCDSPEDFVRYASRMAHEPQERHAMAQRAHDRLSQLAGVKASTESWQEVLRAINTRDNRKHSRHSGAIGTQGAERPKLIIGALSCLHPRYAGRRAKCERTWLRRAEQLGIEVLFLIGADGRVQEPTVVQPEEHGRIGVELHLPCPDDYASLPQKTRMFCQWAYENRDFDYLFKCDDDTYLVPERLLEVLPGLYAGVDYLGNPWSQKVGYASGGAGYLLSNRSARIVADELSNQTGPEDLLVGELMSRHGIELEIDRRFIPFADQSRRPQPKNDLITAHACEVPWATHAETWCSTGRNSVCGHTRDDHPPTEIASPTLDVPASNAVNQPETQPTD